MVAMSSGFIAPYVIGVILESGENLLVQWNIAFYVSGAMCLVGSIVFLTFGKAEIQPWDDPSHNADKIVILQECSDRNEYQD